MNYIHWNTLIYVMRYSALSLTNHSAYNCIKKVDGTGLRGLNNLKILDLASNKIGRTEDLNALKKYVFKKQDC